MDDSSPHRRYEHLRKHPRTRRARREHARRTKRTYRRVYLTVRDKFAVAVGFSALWFAICCWLAVPWMRDLARLGGWPLSIFVIGGVALVPGLMNAFLTMCLILDN